MSINAALWEEVKRHEQGLAPGGPMAPIYVVLILDDPQTRYQVANRLAAWGSGQLLSQGSKKELRLEVPACRVPELAYLPGVAHAEPLDAAAAKPFSRWLSWAAVACTVFMLAMAGWFASDRLWPTGPNPAPPVLNPAPPQSGPDPLEPQTQLAARSKAGQKNIATGAVQKPEDAADGAGLSPPDETFTDIPVRPSQPDADQVMADSGMKARSLTEAEEGSSSALSSPAPGSGQALDATKASGEPEAVIPVEPAGQDTQTRTANSPAGRSGSQADGPEASQPERPANKAVGTGAGGDRSPKLKETAKPDANFLDQFLGFLSGLPQQIQTGQNRGEPVKTDKPGSRIITDPSTQLDVPERPVDRTNIKRSEPVLRVAKAPAAPATAAKSVQPAQPESKPSAAQQAKAVQPAAKAQAMAESSKSEAAPQKEAELMATGSPEDDILRRDPAKLRAMVDSLYLNGLESYQAGNLDKAVQLFEQAVRLDSKRVGLRRTLAWALFEQGSLAQARQHFKLILKDYPQDEEAKSALELLDSARDNQ